MEYNLGVVSTISVALINTFPSCLLLVGRQQPFQPPADVLIMEGRGVQLFFSLTQFHMGMGISFFIEEAHFKPRHFFFFVLPFVGEVIPLQNSVLTSAFDSALPS